MRRIPYLLATFLAALCAATLVPAAASAAQRWNDANISSSLTINAPL